MVNSALHPEKIDGLGKKLFTNTNVIFLICLAFSWLPYLLNHLSIKVDAVFNGSFIHLMLSYGLFIVLGWVGYHIGDGELTKLHKVLGLHGLSKRELIYRRTMIGMQIMGAGIILASLMHILTEVDYSFNTIMTVASGSVMTLGFYSSKELSPVLMRLDPVTHLNSTVQIFIAVPIISYVIFIFYPSILKYLPSDSFGILDQFGIAVMVICGIILVAALMLTKTNTTLASTTFRWMGINLLETPSKNEVLKAFPPLSLITICEILMVFGYFFTADKTILHIYVPATIIITLYIRSTVQAESYHPSLHQIYDSAPAVEPEDNWLDD